MVRPMVPSNACAPGRRRSSRAGRRVLTKFSGGRVRDHRGLRRAPGRSSVMMNYDLQDPPEVIPRLVAAWRGGAGRRLRGSRLAGRRLVSSSSTSAGSSTGSSAISPTSTTGQRGRLQAAGTPSRWTRSSALPTSPLRPRDDEWVGFDQATVNYERHARQAGGPVRPPSPHASGLRRRGVLLTRPAAAPRRCSASSSLASRSSWRPCSSHCNLSATTCAAYQRRTSSCSCWAACR